MAELPQSIRKVIEAFERLPGIGPKSAARLAFYLLTTPKEYVSEMAATLLEMKSKIIKCKQCFGVSEDEYCEICSNSSRNKSIICVVERALDVLAFERAGGYNGVYHVLGGVLNPLDHVGPEDLTILQLIDRIVEDHPIEMIIATNPTMEGEATALYIKKKVESQNLKDSAKGGPASGWESLKITRIGSGLPMGADVEYADMATLSRAMEGRREL